MDRMACPGDGVAVTTEVPVMMAALVCLEAR